MKPSLQLPESTTIQSQDEIDFSSKKDEDAEISDYEKKRLANIAEKKDLFEEKLRKAKLAVKAKPFKCTKCLSEFMKKLQLKSHQCIRCDLCKKYYKTSQSFYNHDKVEHDGHFVKESKLKRPERERKPVKRFVANETIMPLRPFKCSLCRKGFTSKQAMIDHKKRDHLFRPAFIKRDRAALSRF